MKIQVNGYTQDLIQRILDDAVSIQRSWHVGKRTDGGTMNIIGSIYRNASREDLTIAEMAGARLGMHCIDFTNYFQQSLRTLEFMDQVRMIDVCIDIMLTSIVDRESFGNGRDLTKLIANESKSLFLSLGDDIHASQSALSEILGLQQAIGDLNGKNVVVSWGFGDQFLLPNTAHSLLVMLPLVGADVTVLFPKDFDLLNRVKKQGEKTADACGTNIEYDDVFNLTKNRPDAVLSYNWCRLDDYQRTGRSQEKAANHRNWFFSETNLPTECPFLSPPPVQTDLIADEAVISRNSQYLDGWLARRVAVLSSTIVQMLGHEETESPRSLL